MNPSMLNKEDLEVISSLMSECVVEEAKLVKTKRKIDLIIKLQNLTENYQQEASSIREEFLKMEEK